MRKIVVKLANTNEKLQSVITPTAIVLDRDVIIKSGTFFRDSPIKLKNTNILVPIKSITAKRFEILRELKKAWHSKLYEDFFLCQFHSIYPPRATSSNK